MFVIELIARVLFFVIFFFSSRRRHTRSLCDWSSDVCSSDLRWLLELFDEQRERTLVDLPGGVGKRVGVGQCHAAPLESGVARSEERRVGKECRDLGGAGHYEQRVRKNDI